MDLRDRFYKSRGVFRKAKDDLRSFPLEQKYQKIPRETISELDSLCLALFVYDLAKMRIEESSRKRVGRAEGFYYEHQIVGARRLVLDYIKGELSKNSDNYKVEAYDLESAERVCKCAYNFLERKLV